MTEINELKNNIIYKLIVLNDLKEKYDWKQM
jgi:hypothetical protein